MMGIDTNILISIFRKKENAAILEKFASDDMCTSEIVIYELLYGIFASQTNKDARLKEFNALLDTFAYIFPIDRKASTKAAEIAGKLSREGKSISHTDALIAGSLLANGCNKFLTYNKKEFENIQGLELLS